MVDIVEKRPVNNTVYTPHNTHVANEVSSHIGHFPKCDPYRSVSQQHFHTISSSTHGHTHARAHTDLQAHANTHTHTHIHTRASRRLYSLPDGSSTTSDKETISRNNRLRRVRVDVSVRRALRLMLVRRSQHHRRDHRVSCSPLYEPVWTTKTTPKKCNAVRNCLGRRPKRIHSHLDKLFRESVRSAQKNATETKPYVVRVYCERRYAEGRGILTTFTSRTVSSPHSS